MGLGIGTWILLVGGVSVGDVLCIKRADRPGLTELTQFQTRDGKRIDLLQSIGPYSDKFGTCLLVDNDGVKMTNLKINHRSVEQVTRHIFIEWLKGSGKRPETWATVVQCLRSADLNYPADLIEQQFEDGPKQPSSSQSTPERLESPTHAGHDGDKLIRIMTALDEAQSGDKGELVVYGRTIRFKAKWRVHSFNEPIVWDSTAQDVETGIRVEVKHQDSDKYANKLAVRKLCEQLISRGILRNVQDVHEEL